MELVKVFDFSDKKPGFLEIIEVCLNLGIRFCITWLVLLNSHLNHSDKADKAEYEPCKFDIDKTVFEFLYFFP